LIDLVADEFKKANLFYNSGM